MLSSNKAITSTVLCYFISCHVIFPSPLSRKWYNDISVGDEDDDDIVSNYLHNRILRTIRYLRFLLYNKWCGDIAGISCVRILNFLFQLPCQVFRLLIIYCYEENTDKQISGKKVDIATFTERGFFPLPFAWRSKLTSYLHVRGISELHITLS